MIPPQEVLLRLLLAALIGGIVGFEREIHGRAAGFRTQLIVCVAAVLIMVVSQNYYFYVHGSDTTLRIDPARIAAGALIGIGFLGAGVIIKSGFAVRGLTTAASIWMVSAIGLAIGGGLYFEAIITFAITIIALIALRVIERKIKTLRFKVITVSTPASADAEETISMILAKYDFHIHSVDYRKDHGKGEVSFRFMVSTRNRSDIKQLFRELSSLDIVTTINIAS